MTFANASAKTKFVWWGTAVLLIAAIFRLAMLHDVPPGLSQDEVLNADIVQFIRGGYHALFFREGYGHEPLYHYFSVPFQVLLGDNVLSMRLPAVTLGMVLIALTLHWVRREFGVGTAVLTGLGLAISWWPIVFSRVGIRPILEPVLLLLFAWFWPKRPWLAGLFLGLSVYSYTGAWVVFAIPALLALYFAILPRFSQEAQPRLRNAALIVLSVSLLISLPLFLTLRADPSLQQRDDQLAEPLEALQAGDLQPIWQTTVQTLGVFSVTGDPRWTYTLPDRPLFDWGTAVFFYAGLFIVLWHWRQPRFGFVLIWLGVGLIPSAVTPQAPSIGRLIGALPVVYLLPAVAGTSFYQYLQRNEIVGGWQTAVRPLALILLLVIGGINGLRTVRDGFIAWPQAETTRVEHYQTVFLDMARHLQADPVENLVVAEAFFEPIDRDSFIRNIGSDPQARWVQTGEDVAGAVVWPAGGNGRFYVPEFAAPDPTLLQLAGIDETPEFRSEAVPSFAIYRVPNEVPELRSVAPITFADQISLMGYEILPANQGEPLVIFTLWQVETELPADLAIFLHVVDEADQIAVQYDGLDAAVIALQAGDFILQRHVLPTVQLTSATEYTVLVGLYRRSNGQRLLFAGETQDRFQLTTVVIDEK